MKNIRKIETLLLFVTLLFSKVVIAQTTMQDAIEGNYLIEGKGVKVNIYKEGDLYFGKTINSTEKMKEGTLILKQLKYNDGKWKGILFIAAINTGFDCSIILTGTNGIKLDIKFGFLKKSQIWNKIKER